MHLNSDDNVQNCGDLKKAKSEAVTGEYNRSIIDAKCPMKYESGNGNMETRSASLVTKKVAV